jgi:hypothetical protein
LAATSSSDQTYDSPEGTTFTDDVLSTDTTDTNGNYLLRVPSMSDLEPYEDGDGIVNFYVAAPQTGAVNPYSFSLRLADSPSGWVLEDPLTSSYVAGIDESAMEADAITANLTGTGAEELTPTTEPGVALANTAAVDTGPSDPDNAVISPTDQAVMLADLTPEFPCSTRTIVEHPAREGLVSQWYSTVDGVTGGSSYSVGASSKFGEAESASGDFGSWHESGTTSLDSTATETFPSVTGPVGRYWRTNFSAVKVYHLCITAGGSTDWYTNNVNHFDGGATHTDGIPVPASISHCVFQDADSGFSRTDTAAVTWSDGYDLSGVIGIDLSQQTGYSTRAHLSVHFRVGHWLCGEGGDPGYTPYQLAARLDDNGE